MQAAAVLIIKDTTNSLDFQCNYGLTSNYGYNHPMSGLVRGTVLYGMMGSGKTTLGEGLAAHLDQSFIDTDSLIEERFGMSCPEIVADQIRDFSSHQAEAILGYYPDSPTVIATGGSVAVYPDLVDHLDIFGVGIFINVDPKVLEARLSSERIAALNNPKNLSFTELYDERSHSYRKAASFILNIRAEETKEESLERLISLREQVLRLR